MIDSTRDVATQQLMDCMSHWSNEWRDEPNLSAKEAVSRILADAVSYIEELKSALAPFAEAAVDIEDDDKDHWPLWETDAMDLTYGDLRRARSAMSTAIDRLRIKHDAIEAAHDQLIADAVADEREACAVRCETELWYGGTGNYPGKHMASLIRARSAAKTADAADVAELIPVAPASAGEFIKALERLFSAIDGDGFVSNTREAGAAVVDLRRIWKAPTNGGRDD